MQMKRAGLLSSLLFFLMSMLISAVICLPAFAQTVPSSPNCNANDTACNICMSSPTFNATAGAPAIQTNSGQYMIGQMFQIVNNIITNIESGFYNGIVESATFQRILGVAFLLYITVYGAMIMLGMASHRSGEVSVRLLKLAIVYAMTTAGGWAFFATWIQSPVIGGMNDFITAIANTGMGSGSGGSCVSAGSLASGGPMSFTGSDETIVYLSSGAVAMLYGPMSCIFASKFIAGVEALISTGFYGWILALMIIWGMVEFLFMLLGALATYVKAIIGLTFLFGMGPLFFAFYLFEKTRAITEEWLKMILGLALQPMLLFTFLAFYASIVGMSIANLFGGSGGSGPDICYVPWYTMSGLMTMYWWRFTNASSAAGGQWVSAFNGSGSAGAFGDVNLPPVQILNILYFVVLCNLGKNFSNYIGDIATQIAGAGGSANATVSGEQVGGWIGDKLKKGMSSLVGK